MIGFERRIRELVKNLLLIIKGKTEGRVDIRSRAGLSKYSCQLIETSISLSVNSFFSVLSII